MSECWLHTIKGKELLLTFNGKHCILQTMCTCQSGWSRNVGILLQLIHCPLLLSIFIYAQSACNDKSGKLG